MSEFKVINPIFINFKKKIASEKPVVAHYGCYGIICVTEILYSGHDAKHMRSTDTIIERGVTI